jgi:phage/plasmid-like protein (TIGR03299 family)
MVANVDSMFSVRQVPWHREGLVLAEYPGSWDEARILAGLDWEPEEEPVYRLKGTSTIQVPQLETYGMDGEDILYKVRAYDEIKVNETEINPDDKHIVHGSTRKILSVVSKGYTLIHHDEMGQIIEAVLGQPNVKWETAGSLDGGKAVWVLVKLDEPIILPGDNTVTYPYMAITNRHDGKGSCALRTTAIRIVCQNTFGMAEAEGDRHGATYSFRHSKNWKDHIEEAKLAVVGARKEMLAYTELATELLQIRFTHVQRERFITEFIPTPVAGAVSDRVMGNAVEAQNRLRKLFSSPTTQEVAHTAYGALQAATEYLDWIRGARSWESRLNRCLLKPEPAKRKALTIIRDVVKAGV